MSYITKPMGILLNFIYNNLAFGSYGITIIIFTIIIRVLLLPLMVKQYQSMARMQELNPKIQDINKRYKNDKEKLNQELMKVYQENNVNPMAGCLPLIIQLPIMFGLWQAISRPLTYMLGLADKIDPLAKVLNVSTKGTGYAEIEIINKFVVSKVSGIIPADMINIIDHMKYVPAKIMSGFNFLGLNLGYKPSDAFSHYTNIGYLVLLLIPLIATGTTFISSKLSTPKTSQAADNQMQKSMMYIAPLMTFMFSFNFPAGMGLYWITGNIFQIFQQMFINKLILKKKEVQSK